MNKNIKDIEIKRVLEFMNTEIPSEVDDKIMDLIRSETIRSGHVRRFFRISNPVIRWASASALLVIFVVFGLLQLKKESNFSRPLKEIKIEYEIKEKNIKILWVKKEGFLLNRRKK